MGSEFPGFASGVNIIFCIMILSSPQLHLENQIQQAFQVPVIAINKTPYKGLKPSYQELS
ncbi:hypothetical protein [Nostoc sp. PA-18-2419]|uniref:hypothetical protein n=1 Tax=Nostoc sp. PA-18-2419 TaxID=2575443 RepID=UPI001109CFB6|nr:hypothetical protein [Nostoc sp. PA-18-2419]